MAKFDTYTTHHLTGVSGRLHIKAHNKEAELYVPFEESMYRMTLTVRRDDLDDLLELVTALRKHWRPNTARHVCARDEGHAMCPRCNHCQKCWDAHFGPACPP